VTGHGSEKEIERCRRYGVYVMRFYKWVENDEKMDVYLVIDDRIPCNQLGKPLYARSGSEDEMWVMLLEKAYAKLHRNYENLKTGFSDYALRDLTGGMTQQVKWPRPPEEAAPASGQDSLVGRSAAVWSQVSGLLSEGCLIACSASVAKNQRRERDTEGYGILKGHAYSIIDAQPLELAEGGTQRLVRVRNPWGQRGAAPLRPLWRPF
jgi:hypothetical protein